MSNRLLSRALTLLIGVGVGYGLARLPFAHAAKPSTPQKPAWTRVIVGLKDPLTPPVIRELKASLGARIVTLDAGKTYVLILLRPGETLASVKARSPRIAFVEPQTVMSISPDTPHTVVVLTTTHPPHKGHK